MCNERPEQRSLLWGGKSSPWNIRVAIGVWLVWGIVGLSAQTYPSPWPDTGFADVNTGWTAYTQIHDQINDEVGGVDESNGGTTPQQDADVMSPSSPSVFFGYNAANQVLFIRTRLVSDPLTPTPNGGSNDDPWSPTTWSLLIDLDGDGYGQFIVRLNGRTGGPGNVYDDVEVLYQSTDTHDTTSSLKTFSTKMQFPDKDGRAAVHDFGGGRSIDPALSGGGYYIDWQIPLNAFVVSGEQLITPTTPIALGYATANSNTDPMQKDLVYEGAYQGNAPDPFPMGDILTLSGGLLAPADTPLFKSLSISGCGPSQLQARVLDTLYAATVNTLASSIDNVEFFYQRDSDGDGNPDPGAPINSIGVQTNWTGTDFGLWEITWNNSNVLNSKYDIFARATDEQGHTTQSTKIIYNHTCGVNGVDVSGVVYRDANHNRLRDSGEDGTNETLYAKIFKQSTPGGPALKVATVDPNNGTYTFTAVEPETYIIIIDTNNDPADVTPTRPAGWVGTEIPNQKREQVKVNDRAVTGQNFGLYKGSQIAGRVFADTGQGGGTANDGVQNGSEVGIDSVPLKATNAAGSTTYDNTWTNGAGDYELWVPSTATTVKVVETNLNLYLSIGGNAGNTGGAYTRSTDTTEFTQTSGTNYSNATFADVLFPEFVFNNQKTTLPGSMVVYQHTFVAGTAGQVRFDSAQTANPAQTGWNYVVYRDVNGDGKVDAGDYVLFSTTVTNVTATEQLYLLIRVFVPPGAPDTAEHKLTITPEFTYTNANPALTQNATNNVDTTLVKLNRGHLLLSKSVDKSTAKPGEILTYTILYVNIGIDTVSEVILSDPISTRCNLVLGAFPGSKDILWQKPDGTTVYLTAVADADEGTLEDIILYVRMGAVQVPAGSSGMVQYMAKIK